ncbi:MAG: PAS domain-containing protein [Deltaproteobacteria bacterium]|nr:PAS domain-containing protein [Deltaproteobacteria bacterium]
MNDPAFRSIFRALHEGVAIFDADGRVVEINPAAGPLLALAEDDLRDGAVRPGPIEAVNERGDPIPEEELPFYACLRTGTPRTDVVLGLRGKGKRVRWFLVSAVPLVGGGTVASMLDFTAIKNARDEIEQRKDEFITTLSHEMRTPLMSLNGAVSLLHAGAAGAVPESALPLLGVARRNADRLIRLVNDVLDLERILAGTMSLSLGLHELNKIARIAAEAASPLATAAGVQLAVIPSEKSILLQTDVDRVQQILANLLSNAIKFSPRGATVEIRVTRVAQRGQVTVRDFGPGVPKHFRSRLFLKFSQADPGGRTRGERGSGLGLSISRAIAAALGGEVGHEEPVGRGAAFFLALPRERSTA